MNYGRTILLLILLMFPAVLYADIYKCVSEDGVTKFSDQPCGKQSEVFAALPGLDDLISMARPFKPSRIDPNRISTLLLEHSRRIGAQICPGLPMGGSHIEAKNDKRSVWLVKLGYLEKKRRIWNIEIQYKKKRGPKGYGIWLGSISIQRWHKHFSAPTMEQVTQLRKIAPGKYVEP